MWLIRWCGGRSSRANDYHLSKLIMPKVSVLTITYNRAPLIHRCIESVRNQSYHDYEHIIADGASDDNTEEVVLSYNDPKIKYLKLRQSGPEYQMREAFKVSSGEYITFLDDDDEYLPDKIKKQVDFFDRQPSDIGMIYCWMSYYDEKKPDSCINIHAPQLRGNIGDIQASIQPLSGTPTLMIKRDIYESVGGTYDDSCGYIGSDKELVTSITQITKVNYLPESLVKVYINHDLPRLSTNFYSQKIHKDIIYHKHYLSKFYSVFDRKPYLATYHLFEICRDYFKLQCYSEGFRWYWRMLKTKPSLKQVIKPLIGIIINK